jgi:hypothetical protein
LAKIKKDNFDLTFDYGVMKVFDEIGESLYQIYRHYFSHEIANAVRSSVGHANIRKAKEQADKLWSQSEKKLFDLLRDFDVCPFVLSKGVVYQIFKHTKEYREVKESLEGAPDLETAMSRKNTTPSTIYSD